MKLFELLNKREEDLTLFEHLKLTLLKALFLVLIVSVGFVVIYYFKPEFYQYLLGIYNSFES